MMRSATSYDLSEKDERLRSVADLENFFFRMMGYLAPSLFVEAGARNAKVSAHARRRLPEARIVAFEANPITHARFLDSSWIGQSNIEYVHSALSDEVGELTFSLKVKVDGQERDRTEGDGSLNAPAAKNVELEDHAVVATTLDEEFVGVEGDDSFVWIDVEGAQRQVLSGGERFLEEHVAFVFMEVEDRVLWEGQWLSVDVNNFMIDRGFVPYARDFQSRYQYNILYVHERYVGHDYLQRAYHEYLSTCAVSRVHSISPGQE